MFRFSIRDIMLVMVVVGLVLGWWVDRSRLANEAESFRTMSLALASQLQNKNLGSNIQIIVNGDVVRLRNATDASLFAKYPPQP